MYRLRFLNVVLCSLGVVVFAMGLLFLDRAPDKFGQLVQNYAVSEVSDRFQEQVVRFEQEERLEGLKSLARDLSDQLAKKIELRQAALKLGGDEFVANVLTAHCQIECGKREEARELVRSFFEAELVAVQHQKEQIERFILKEYDDVLSELRRDIQIFCVSNLIAFLFALGLAVFKGRASVHLLPISLLLSVATGIATYFYVFGQNWVLTILFNNYWGWSYLGFICFLFLLLIDIALNRARITSFVINLFCNVLGAAFSVLPC